MSFTLTWWQLAIVAVIAALVLGAIYQLVMLAVDARRRQRQPKPTPTSAPGRPSPRPSLPVDTNEDIGKANTPQARKVLKYLRDRPGEWANYQMVGKGLGIPPLSVSTLLTALYRLGHVEREHRSVGGRGLHYYYRVPATKSQQQVPTTPETGGVFGVAQQAPYKFEERRRDVLALLDKPPYYVTSAMVAKRWGVQVHTASNYLQEMERHGAVASHRNPQFRGKEWRKPRPAHLSKVAVGR